MQAAFVRDVISRLDGVHTAIETSGFCEPDEFKKTVDMLDYIIMDLKLADSAEHKKYTGVSNELILENYRYLKFSGKLHLIRTPLIPGITDTEKNLAAIEEIASGSPMEKLPYNALAGAKYPSFGMVYPLSAEKENTNIQ